MQVKTPNINAYGYNWYLVCAQYQAQIISKSCSGLIRKLQPNSLAQSLVTLEKAVAVSTQIGAECYVETKALVSSLETHEVDIWIIRLFLTFNLAF